MGRPAGRRLRAGFCDRPRLLVLLLDISEIRQPSAWVRATLLLEPAKNAPRFFETSLASRSDDRARWALGSFLSDPRSSAL
jgi:hypothetical protein